MVDGISSKHVLYAITLIDVQKYNVWVDDGGEYVVNATPNKITSFFSAEETIQFLSDKELFGWEVKSWDINDSWNEYTQLHIELYRFNCD